MEIVARPEDTIEKEVSMILLEDELSDWLQIWMVASSLDVNGNKAIVFLANWSVFPRAGVKKSVFGDPLWLFLFCISVIGEIFF